MEVGVASSKGPTPPRHEKHRCAQRVFDSLPSMTSLGDFFKLQSLSGCHIKAENYGFYLRYCLFQCQHWFFQNLEISMILVLSATPCSLWTALYIYDREQTVSMHLESVQNWLNNCSAGNFSMLFMNFFKLYFCSTKRQCPCIAASTAYIRKVKP